MIDAPEWKRALETLRIHCPGVDSFDPDEIDRAAEAAGGPLSWHALSDVDELDDGEIWKALRRVVEWPPTAAVTVVTDACYRNKIPPHQVTFSLLAQWIEGFVDEFDDTVFGGDATFVCDAGALLFHHEGMYAVIGKVT